MRESHSARMQKGACKVTHARCVAGQRKICVVLVRVGVVGGVGVVGPGMRCLNHTEFVTMLVDTTRHYRCKCKCGYVVGGSTTTHLSGGKFCTVHVPVHGGWPPSGRKSSGVREGVASGNERASELFFFRVER